MPVAGGSAGRPEEEERQRWDKAGCAWRLRWRDQTQPTTDTRIGKAKGPLEEKLNVPTSNQKGSRRGDWGK